MRKLLKMLWLRNRTIFSVLLASIFSTYLLATIFDVSLWSKYYHKYTSAEFKEKYLADPTAIFGEDISYQSFVDSEMAFFNESAIERVDVANPFFAVFLLVMATNIFLWMMDKHDNYDVFLFSLPFKVRQIYWVKVAGFIFTPIATAGLGLLVFEQFVKLNVLERFNNMSTQYSPYTITLQGLILLFGGLIILCGFLMFGSTPWLLVILGGFGFTVLSFVTACQRILAQLMRLMTDMPNTAINIYVWKWFTGWPFVWAIAIICVLLMYAGQKLFEQLLREADESFIRHEYLKKPMMIAIPVYAAIILAGDYFYWERETLVVNIAMLLLILAILVIILAKLIYNPAVLQYPIVLNQKSRHKPKDDMTP
ncbi:hypothetical protein EQG49_07825 [Periweissella cryptocerci]|uniref:ABC transporter permease n=1 Tax=Periweissella cryptocerci TaxID=2506420 RepID=A0A4P6YUL0_9LACO|nr:hypothetical protein [Periweissella cryptocerci]QBO36377.1 hypothetical protein EQG49_07825 [Periweissella cryptocerci]